jgi:hypothetical protein
MNAIEATHRIFISKYIFSQRAKSSCFLSSAHHSLQDFLTKSAMDHTRNGE